MLLYGSECWRLRKVDTRKIVALEMSWLSKLLGYRDSGTKILEVDSSKQKRYCDKILTGRLRWFLH